MYWIVGHRKVTGQEWWRSGPFRRKADADQALRYVRGKAPDVFCTYSITKKPKHRR